MKPGMSESRVECRVPVTRKIIADHAMIKLLLCLDNYHDCYWGTFELMSDVRYGYGRNKKRRGHSGWERRKSSVKIIESSSFFYQNMVSRA